MKPHVVTSTVEHDSIAAPLRHLQQQGVIGWLKYILIITSSVIWFYFIDFCVCLRFIGRCHSFGSNTHKNKK